MSEPHFRVFPIATGRVVWIGPKRVPNILTDEIVGDFWLLEGEVTNIDPVNSVNLIIQDKQGVPITLFPNTPLPPGAIATMDSLTGRLFKGGISWQASVLDKLDGWLIGIAV